MKFIASRASNISARALKGLKILKKGIASEIFKRAGIAAALPLVLVIAACAGPNPPAAQAPLPHYRCEHKIDFSVSFVDDTAVLNGSGGQDVLYRNAGGQGDMQRFYSNPRMQAEFGLGAQGREAILRYPLLPLVARCALD